MPELARFFGVIIRMYVEAHVPHHTSHFHIYHVQSFEIVAPYILRVQFNDDSEQIIDFRPILAGELYRPLSDLSLFNQVRIDPEVRTLVWPNGADFDPATLHDWPEHVDAWTTRAQQCEVDTCAIVALTKGLGS